MPRLNPFTNRSNWGLFLLEVGLIVIGVLLGMAVNEWRIERANKAQAERSLEQIKSELLYNRQQVESIVDYHTSLRDSLMSIANQVFMGEVDISYEDLRGAMPNGFSVPFLQRSAWDLAHQTGATSHMDYKPARALALYYNFLDFVEGKLERISDNLYSATSMDPASVKGLTVSLGLLANDLVIQEHEVLEFTDSLMVHLADVKEAE